MKAALPVLLAIVAVAAIVVVSYLIGRLVRRLLNWNDRQPGGRDPSDPTQTQTGTLCAGSNYAISAAGGSQPIHVDFAGMQGDVAVLEFTAVPGHIEGPESTIRFSSWVSADGHQHFDVTGHDTSNYDGLPASWPMGFLYGTASHIADVFAVESMSKQLATQVNGGVYPNG
jgi:hypothetical protein